MREIVGSRGLECHNFPSFPFFFITSVKYLFHIPFLLFGYTDGQRIIFHFSFPFLLLRPWFYFFFWRRFYQKNVFTLFTLATGLTKRFSWPQIEKVELNRPICLCVVCSVYGLEIYHSMQEKVLEPRNIIVSCSFVQYFEILKWFSYLGKFPFDQSTVQMKLEKLLSQSNRISFLCYSPLSNYV